MEKIGRENDVPTSNRLVSIIRSGDGNFWKRK